MRRARGSIAVGMMGTVAFVVAAVVAPAHRAQAGHAYLLFVTALIVRRLVVEALAAAGPVAWPQRWKRAQVVTLALPPDLSRIVQSLSTSTTWSAELFYRVRPMLQQIADHRLYVRRGINLGAEPDAAHAALGDEAWSLLRPDLEVPADRFGPGVSLTVLESIVSSLEEV